MKNDKRTPQEIVAWYDSMTTKPYDPVFVGEKRPGETLPEIESILTLNKDMEPFVIQNSATRTEFLGNDYETLQFVHCSDVHAAIENWNRMVEYINHYSEYIHFGLHTGDYCGGMIEEYHDFYGEGTPCVRPILNCAGNHDTVPMFNANNLGHNRVEKSVTHGLLFNHTENWDVNFMDCEYSMTYYKDFPNANVRLIVLDLYHDIEQQIVWLKQVFADAKEKGYHVMTAAHEPSDELTEKLDVTFQTLTQFSRSPKSVFEDTIAEFVADGGTFICHLAGHTHHDLMGFTEKGVLNVVVECGSDWAGWCDSKRIRGTKTYDCFNVVGVNVNAGILKLVRIGDNADYFLRTKRVLCYDYINKKLIFNG